jgi:hypothetical protein
MLGLSGKATALSRSFQQRAASPRQPALCPAEEQRLAKPGRGHIQIERHEVWLELVMSGHGRKCGGYHGMCLTRMVRECEGLRRLAGSRGAWERVKDYCRLVTGQCISTSADANGHCPRPTHLQTHPHNTITGTYAFQNTATGRSAVEIFLQIGRNVIRLTPCFETVTSGASVLKPLSIQSRFSFHPPPRKFRYGVHAASSTTGLFRLAYAVIRLD